jgi:hypothetical protein
LYLPISISKLRPTSLFIFNCFKKRGIAQLSSGGST